MKGERILRVKVPPLLAIDWRENNYLLEFTRKLESGEIALDEPRRARLWDCGLNLSHNFVDIALIVSRIDEDRVKVNRIIELFEIARTREDRMWTDEEANEYETLTHAVNFFTLDVRTLLIYVVVFMDTLAKFLSWTIKATRQPSSRSFAAFRKDILNYRGDEVQRLSHLLNEGTVWFKDVIDLRDDFIIHHPAAMAGLGFANGRASVHLRTSKGDQWQVVKRIPVKRIDGYLSQLKDLLRNLNEFLCSRTAVLPIESEYVRSVADKCAICGKEVKDKKHWYWWKKEKEKPCRMFVHDECLEAEISDKLKKIVRNVMVAECL